ncbi:MAG: hypothetical protein K0Q79_854 [Flavipsychrobacter sp.]|jgi:hypothetical protein|nr:hypothetical protein [Flavipsychrobacter sp.]
MNKIALILLAGSLFIFNGCTKTGPQGPQGPQGNANVRGSDPFNVTSWSFSSSENAYVASFTDADITQAVADRGVVEMFLFYTADNTWRPLPDILNGTQFYHRFSKGGFEIYYTTVDGSTPAFPTGTWTFRTVVISPSNKQAHPNTNWKNYNEAMQALQEDAQVAPAVN